MALTQINSDGISVNIPGGTNGVDLDDSVKARFGAGNDLEIFHDGSHSWIKDVGTGALQLSGGRITMRTGNVSSEYMFTADADGAVELYYDNSKKFETKSDGVDITGELQCDSLDVDGGADFTGNVVTSTYFQSNRTSTAHSFLQGYLNGSLTLDLKANGAATFNSTVSDSKGDVRDIPQNSKTAAYTLVAGDAGKHINITTGGVTVPSSVFQTGDAVTIYNDSSSDQTVTQGSSVTLRSAGTADTGNRTLAQRGICTLLCVASNEFVISGAGLS